MSAAIWTDTKGQPHEIRLTRDVAIRLKAHGVCDLGRCLMNPEALSDLFMDLGSDSELIINFAYVAEFETPGNEQHQREFARLVWGDGSDEGTKLLEVGEALTTAVIDFFPVKHREHIRRLWVLRKAKELKGLMTYLAEVSAECQSGLTTDGNGSSGSAELLEATAAN